MTPEPTEEPEIELPEEEVPLADLPEEEVPLADLPLEDLADEEVPLGDVPVTGDASILWYVLSVLSGGGIAGLTVLEKKRKED